jgi:sterol desaturase/sphingolipid hydroxylase (fatty acid hydroxylase superfamily)
MERFVNAALFEYSYPELFAWTVVYFLLLYFGLGTLFQKACELLERVGVLSKIKTGSLFEGQIKYEIGYSLSSMILFGFSVLPIIYLVRNGRVALLPNTLFPVVGGLVLLTLWNELHFYLVHRLMHHPYLMKKVHHVHHRSRIPTIYSVFSFHWFEAFLLSTIPLTIVPFVPFSMLAVFLFPTVSILLNFAGHCNYRFGGGSGQMWTRFGTHHNEHHSRGRKNYGFAFFLFDRLFSKHNK